MCVILTNKIRTIYIQTLTTLDGDNTQTFYGATRINLLQQLVDITDLLNHWDFTSQIESKETQVIIN